MNSNGLENLYQNFSSVKSFDRSLPQQSAERQEAHAYAEQVSIYMMIANGVRWFGIGGLQNILPLYAYLTWGTSPWKTGIVLLASSICSAMMLPAWIKAGYSWGFGRVVTLSYLPSVFLAPGMALSNSFPLFGVIFAINSFFNVTDEVVSTFVAIVMPLDDTQAWLTTNAHISQTLFMIALVLAGVSFEFIHRQIPFLAVGFISFLTFIFGLSTVVGRQEMIEEKVVEAYLKDLETNEFEKDDTYYVPGFVKESEEFPMVLKTYEGDEMETNFWDMSPFETMLFYCLLLIFAIFVGSMSLIFVWWPLLCHQKWNVGPTLANAQLVLMIVASTAATISAPKALDWFAMAFCSVDPQASVPPSEEPLLDGDTETTVPERVVTPRNRDKSTAINFFISNLVTIPLWYFLIIQPIQFQFSWIIAVALGWMRGWSFTCIILLFLRFHGNVDAYKMFGIQGVMWQVMFGMFHLAVGFVWSSFGYQGVALVPMIGNALVALLAFVVYVGYDNEATWSVKE